jgi:hypothetical protein
MQDRLAAAAACNNWKSWIDILAKVQTVFPRFCGRKCWIFTMDSEDNADIKAESWKLTVAQVQVRLDKPCGSNSPMRGRAFTSA